MRNKKKNVLMIGLTPPLEGGSERVIYELSSRIKDTTVFTQWGSLCKKKLRVKIPGRPVFLRNVIFALLVKLYCISLLLTPKKKYDIIHIHENLLYFLAIPLSWRYKVVITVHGMKGFKFYDNKFLWFFFKQGLKFADEIIAVSLADKELLNKEFERVIYIPNGVDLSLYKKIKAPVEKKITFIGRIHEQKGVVYLLEGFEKIKKRYPDYKLEIIGEINDYARKLQMKFDDNQIIWRGFLGKREEIVKSLKSAYCIALPSLWEGLPLTLFEALASGRPVIVSDIPAFKNVAGEGDVLFSKAGSNENLAMVLDGLLGDYSEALRLGENGSKLAAMYDWKNIAKKTENAYNKL